MALTDILPSLIVTSYVLGYIGDPCELCIPFFMYPAGKHGCYCAPYFLPYWRSRVRIWLMAKEVLLNWTDCAPTLYL